MVYHDHDQIISMEIRKSSDEIHGYGGERDGVFDGQRGESGYRGMGVHLGRLAVGTSRDKSVKKGRHSWPPIVLLHLVKSSEESFMASSRGLVEQSYQIMASRLRNIETVFEI